MIGLVVVVVVAAVAVVGWINLRRHGESGVAAADWRRTDEVFRDPSSGRLMRVWLDPADGSRHYVPDGAGGRPGG
ncbi:MAG: hypothetical protein M3066_00490 [Actinomycetota bacterium]|nr:hypothetical protein [Actinomycetota bacterium]